jgi:oligoendopeptidase F
MRKMLAYLGREFYAQNQDTTGRQEQLEKYIANYEDNLRRAENIEIYSSNLMAVKTTDEGLARKIDFVVFHTQ